MLFRLIMCALMIVLAVMTMVGEGRMAIGTMLILAVLALPAIDTAKNCRPRPSVRRVRRHIAVRSSHRRFAPLTVQ